MIYKYKFKDNFIVLDVNSGSVHLVHELVYDLLDFYEGKSRDEIIIVLKDKYEQSDIECGLDEIQYLVDEGMLYADDTHIDLKMTENRDTVIKALCLHVAHDCNMKCRYCFADQGAFDGQRSLMSIETGKLALDFLLTHSGTRHNLEVDFFGGEPLMNFEVVKKLVDYGREQERLYNKRIRFTITTNGLMLDDDKIDYINSVMDNVILSIDGRPKVHDYMRQTINGKGTYDAILKNYKNFVRKREGLYYVRGTFTRENLDFLADIKHLADVGFSNISVEPAVLDAKLAFALRDEDLERIFDEYDKLADYYLEKAKAEDDFDFFHFNIDLEQGPCVIKRMSGCGAGTEYLAVSPEGDLYPCHQFVGNKAFLIGNLKDKIYENQFYHFFNNAHIYNKEDCRNCWAKFYCSGGCHANAYNINGDIKKPYVLGCEMERKRVKCAIGIKIELNK
jgi:uncharacterized protein